VRRAGGHARAGFPGRQDHGNAYGNTACAKTSTNANANARPNPVANTVAVAEL